MTATLADLGLVEAAALVAERSVSPVELVEACLERIARLDGQLLAFVEVLADQALAAAATAEREIGEGSYRGPLHGIPIAIKDLVDLAGVPTRAGSRILADAGPAPADAPVVARLKEAGAVVLGKTTTHEFAFSVFTPPTRNPWNLDRVPGGSSGGSGAAVAAGMAFAAIGTDTGGSIRIPAACCGVVGLKPTYGRVPKAGVIPLSWSLDHIGPLARQVEDVGIFLQAIAGSDVADPMTVDAPVPDFRGEVGRGLTGLRVGVPDRHFDRRLQPSVAAAVEAATEHLRRAGAIVERVAMPTLDHAMDVHFVTILAEAAAYHRARFPGRDADYGPDVRAALALGDRMSAAGFLQAQRVRRTLLDEAVGVFATVDVLITPTLPTEAPAIGQDRISYPDGEEDALTSLIRFTCPFNQTGLPAITVPAGTGHDGLPLGIQLVAPPLQEARLVGVAAVLEAFAGTGDPRPPIIRTP
ncbi:MAG: amidase [Chloroflexota bacterium]|nr:amidase [Chloroflexota bacterium]